MKVPIVQEWKGQSAIVIGGGPSLKAFQFKFLIGENTIGVNDAFRLGPKITKICLFGDSTWWHKVKFDLDQYIKAGGRAFSVCPSLEGFNLPNICQLERAPRKALGAGGALAWNFSTGAAAVNLAVNLGAAQIFLLGFDMGLALDKSSHWHQYLYRQTASEDVYVRFLRGFDALAKGLKELPDVKVFNVTDGSSRLPHFERLSFSEFTQRLDYGANH